MKQRIRTALKAITGEKWGMGFSRKIGRKPTSNQQNVRVPSTPLFSVERLNESIRRARDRFLNLQSEEGYWVFDLEADATIPSEYILLQRFLGREIDSNLKLRIANYLRNHPDGQWRMAPLSRRGG